MASLFSELRRRNVFRVGAAYLVVAWLLTQAADILLGNFGAPEWVFRSFVALLLLGFPLALFLAWAYELTPNGVRRADAVERDAGTGDGRSIDRLIIVGLMAALALLTVERFWSGQSVEHSEPPPVSAVPLADPSPGPLAADARHALAVLPFANMSPDPEQGYFADGITEDILTRLAGLGGLRVISRTSVMRYKNSELSLPQIATELGVSHVLEGSVRRVGEQVRITGQLIHAASDEQLWAESYDRELADIFAVQTDIAKHIAEALQLHLTARDQRQLMQGGTGSARAYESYLLGQAAFHARADGPATLLSTMDSAERHFRAALAEDPDFALAHAGLARALISALALRPQEERESRYRASLESARRTVVLAPDVAAGYVQLGRAFRVRGQHDAAMAQFQLAAAIDPDDPETLAEIADNLAEAGQLAEAIQLRQRVTVVAPGVAAHHDALGALYLWLGALERAEHEYRVAYADIDPIPARLSCHLGQVAAYGGEFETARRLREHSVALAGDAPFARRCALYISFLLRDWAAAAEHIEAVRAFMDTTLPLEAARVVVRLGDEARLTTLLATAQRNLHEVLPFPRDSQLAYFESQIALLRGDTDLALDNLELAITLGWRRYGRLDLDPVWDPVRDEKRFLELAALVDASLARIRAEIEATTSRLTTPWLESG